MRTHAAELKNLLNHTKSPPDVICVSETFLKTKHTFTLPGYEIIRGDKDGDLTKGGVATLVRSGVQYKNLDLKLQKIDGIGVEISTKNSHITVVNMYDSPDDSINGKDYADIFSISGKVVVTGDFNAHNPLWKSSQMDRRGEYVEQLLEDYDFTLLNTEQPTYQRPQGGATVLDLSFSSNSIANKCEWSVGNNTLGSDHLPTFIDIDENATEEGDRSRTCNLAKANWDKFQNLLGETKRGSLFHENVNIYNDNITKTILAAANKSIPTKLKGGGKSKAVPYWNESCSQTISQRNKARNKLNKSSTLTNQIDYKRAKAVAQRTLKNEQSRYWQKYCSSLNKNTKLGKVWQMSKRMGGRQSSCFKVPTLKTDKGIHVTNAEKAEALAETFASASATANYPDAFIEHKTKFEKEQKILFSNESTPNPNPDFHQPFSITELNCAITTCKKDKAAGPDDIPYEFVKHFPESFNEILLDYFNFVWSTGSIPDTWRHAVILPLHKLNKPKEETSSYRPISLTSCLCKVQEKMVTNRLTHYLESNHLLTNYQTGFRKDRSTLDQILKLQDTISKHNSNRGFTVAAFLDFEKAYDMLWRPGLLMKIKRLGIHGNMFSFIESFVSERTFQVKVGSVLSEAKILENGTPQGSIISPILFLIMINDMAEICPGVELSLFADDSATYKSGKDLKTLVSDIQKALDHISDWCDDWGLQISLKKSSVVVFTHRVKYKVEPILFKG